MKQDMTTITFLLSIFSAIENEEVIIVDQVDNNTEPHTQEPSAAQDIVVDGQNSSLELRLVIQDESIYLDSLLVIHR
jgi:hypothetical protein